MPTLKKAKILGIALAAPQALASREVRAAQRYRPIPEDQAVQRRRPIPEDPADLADLAGKDRNYGSEGSNRRHDGSDRIRSCDCA